MRSQITKVNIHHLKNGRFQAIYIHPEDGKRKRKSFSTIQAAEGFKERTIIEMASAKTRLASYEGNYVGQILKVYLGRHPYAPIAERKVLFRRFVNFFGMFPLGKVSRDSLEFWFEQLRQELGYCNKTLSKIRCNVNRFLEWCIDEELIHSNPLERIKFKQTEPPKRDRVILSKGEVKTVLQELNAFSPDALYPAIYLTTHTGCRRSEMLGLEWKDIDFANGFLTFRDTKNGTNRRVNMAGCLAEFLKSHPHTGDTIVTGKRGGMLGRSQLQKGLKAFKSESTVKKDWRPHDLRHSFAYHFLKDGGKDYQLQAILGHKTIGMTVNLYGRIKAEDVDRPSPFE